MPLKVSRSRPVRAHLAVAQAEIAGRDGGRGCPPARDAPAGRRPGASTAALFKRAKIEIAVDVAVDHRQTARCRGAAAPRRCRRRSPAPRLRANRRCARRARAPSPSPRSITSPRCETLITRSTKPARARRSIRCTMSGRPPASIMGLGNCVGKRAHALAAAGGEDHRLHLTLLGTTQ